MGSRKRNPSQQLTPANTKVQRTSEHIFETVSTVFGDFRYESKGGDQENDPHSLKGGFYWVIFHESEDESEAPAIVFVVQVLNEDGKDCIVAECEFATEVDKAGEFAGPNEIIVTEEIRRINGGNIKEGGNIDKENGRVDVLEWTELHHKYRNVGDSYYIRYRSTKQGKRIPVNSKFPPDCPVCDGPVHAARVYAYCQECHSTLHKDCLPSMPAAYKGGKIIDNTKEPVGCPSCEAPMLDPSPRPGTDSSEERFVAQIDMGSRYTRAKGCIGDGPWYTLSPNGFYSSCFYYEKEKEMIYGTRPQYDTAGHHIYPFKRALCGEGLEQLPQDTFTTAALAEGFFNGALKDLINGMSKVIPGPAEDFLQGPIPKEITIACPANMDTKCKNAMLKGLISSARNVTASIIEEPKAALYGVLAEQPLASDVSVLLLTDLGSFTADYGLYRREASERGEQSLSMKPKKYHGLAIGDFMVIRAMAKAVHDEKPDVPLEMLEMEFQKWFDDYISRRLKENLGFLHERHGKNLLSMFKEQKRRFARLMENGIDTIGDGVPNVQTILLTGGGVRDETSLETIRNKAERRWPGVKVETYLPDKPEESTVLMGMVKNHEQLLLGTPTVPLTVFVKQEPIGKDQPEYLLLMCKGEFLDDPVVPASRPTGLIAFDVESNTKDTYSELEFFATKDPINEIQNNQNFSILEALPEDYWKLGEVRIEVPNDNYGERQSGDSNEEWKHILQPHFNLRGGVVVVESCMARLKGAKDGIIWERCSVDQIRNDDCIETRHYDRFPFVLDVDRVKDSKVNWNPSPDDEGIRSEKQ